MKKTTLQEAFEKTKRFSSKPSNAELLQLYSLYKQATEGDITGERPGGFDLVAAAKYNAWQALGGMSEGEASESYVELVENLAKKYI